MDSHVEQTNRARDQTVKALEIKKQQLLRRVEAANDTFKNRKRTFTALSHLSQEAETQVKSEPIDGATETSDGLMLELVAINYQT